jgi:hypothetical protein
MWISMIISPRCPTIPMIVEMTIHNPTTSMFNDHPGKQLPSAHPKIPSCHHLDNE